MISRRNFLKATAATGVVLGVGGFIKPRKALAAFYQSPNIPLFKTTLRGIDVIPVAAPDVGGAPVTGVTHYTINIGQFQDQIVPAGSISALGDKTTLWGYHPANPLQGTSFPQAHLGGIIVGQKGHPIQITFQNMLPLPHILPVDRSIPGADNPLLDNRAAVHLHGGLVPWISDGGPFDSFTPKGTHGDSFLNNEVFNPLATRGQAEYYYPLNQSARFMWYHDHAVGITRLNAYAGIASGMLIRDKFEERLKLLGLPEFIEVSVLAGKTPRELPIIIQDKIFVGTDIAGVDPDYQGLKDPGSLWYAHDNPDATNPPVPTAVPEFFGDTMLVNGTSYPTQTVEARRYRLRLLNACNARFLNLQLYVADDSGSGITLNLKGSPNPTIPDPVNPPDGTLPNPDFNKKYGTPTNTPFVNAATGKSTWLQIGTEGGFLATPALVPSNIPLVAPPEVAGSVDPSKFKKSLLVAPAERPDVIVDFRLVPKNPDGTYKSIILYNDAPSPFPGGGPDTDYFPNLYTPEENPANFGHGDDVGPNSRVLMRFDVIAASGPADKKLALGDWSPLFLGLDPFLLPPFVHQVPNFIKKRFLTLNEISDEFGRLIQILGNDAAPFGSPYFGTAKYEGYPVPIPATGVGATEEEVNEGAVEVWEIYNTTADVHPMHFHLVNVQVVNRQLFDPRNYPYLPSGPIIPADQNEAGWKETVQMYPGTVTRCIMKFDLAKIVDSQGRPINTKLIKNGQPPESPRTGGMEYVWHCHILEHEEHDMMHALVVTPKKK